MIQPRAGAQEAAAMLAQGKSWHTETQHDLSDAQAADTMLFSDADAGRASGGYTRPEGSASPGQCRLLGS